MVVQHGWGAAGTLGAFTCASDPAGAAFYLGTALCVTGFRRAQEVLLYWFCVVWRWGLKGLADVSVTAGHSGQSDLHF